MKKYGKKYVEASKNVDKNKAYTLEDAIKLVKETSVTKFDSTIDVAIKLNIDPKKSDQQLKGALSLPNGTGKTKKVLVIAKGAFAEEAKKAGADVVVATPDMMPEVGRIGNILGPRNLMPNPKTGTVTTKVGAIVEDLKKGMVTYKNDKFGNIHTVIGKVSFDEKKLAENLTYVVTTISKAKPQTVKGTFIENIAISTTMGPGIKLDKNSFDI